LEPKWLSVVGRWRNNGADAQEDLAKSGCKPGMSHKSLISLLFFWLNTENQI
jgi:hypothetical protein